MSLEELILRHALHLEIATLCRENVASGVLMIPIPSAGILRQVEGIDAALQISGIEEITITAKLLQRLIPLPEGSSYLGFIFARGQSPDQVEQALRKAHQQLRFIITPSLPLA